MAGSSLGQTPFHPKPFEMTSAAFKKEHVSVSELRRVLIDLGLPESLKNPESRKGESGFTEKQRQRDSVCKCAGAQHKLLGCRVLFLACVPYSFLSPTPCTFREALLRTCLHNWPKATPSASLCPLSLETKFTGFL